MAQLLVIHLLFACFGKASGGSFPYPENFSHTARCDTCNGTGASDCASSDCTERCSGLTRQCFKADRYKLGCCCDPTQEPPADRYKCQRGAKHSGFCILECCKTVRSGDRTFFPTICGEGCCKPGDQCGSSWLLPVAHKTGTLKRRPCCLQKGAVQDHQNGARCCLHGDGVNMSTPEEAPCCLLQSTTTVHSKNRSSDPHAICQRNSSKAGYRPCPANGAGRGVLCGSSGDVFQSQSQQKVCCLKETKPSVNDPCQVDYNDCRVRYKPCHQADQLGIDCASATGKSACCLPPGVEVAGSCRSGCTAWKKEQNARLGKTILLLFLGVTFLTLLGLFAYKNVRASWRQVLNRLEDSARFLLLSNGELARASPMVNHERRVLLSISCQHYSSYTPLTAPYADADMLETQCGDYDKVINVRGTTRDVILEGFNRALQEVAGTVKSLLLVSFSGHAKETTDGKMMWAPEDADPNDLSTHVNVAELFCDLMQVHLNEGIDRFGRFLRRLRPPEDLYYVVLADCCRDPTVLNSHFNALGRQLRNRKKRPNMHIIYSCGPGRRAQDVCESGHSPFMEQVKDFVGAYQCVSSFADSVNGGLRRKTDGRQELWQTTVSGSFQCVSLALPPPRSRSGSLGS